MTTAQVRRLLGPDPVLMRREQRRGGRIYVEYQWDLRWWSVGFLGRPGQLRVVKVASSNRAQRTPEGLGVGSTYGQLSRKLEIGCKEIFEPGGRSIPTHTECVHSLANGRQTVFVFEKWAGANRVVEVAYVEVRARGCDFYGRNCRAR